MYIDTLYKENEANYPRLKTDVFFADYENIYKFKGFLDKAFHYIEDFQLTDPSLWKRFVQQFREDADHDAGWRGEYWGKMMRGACFTYCYTQDEKLYNILVETIRDMMDSQDGQGRISSYALNHEFDGWDIWSRKYVLLGMQYFMEICTDESLKQEITACMCRQVDYIISKIGSRADGKTPITEATRHWRGLNSSSLLEPIIRLYTITNEQKYFDFATYIVECGGTSVCNIFDLAYENKMYPYQYPVTKAYEMTSCFEGLLEYYRLTGIEKYKIAVVNYAKKILESDYTIIGSCGCTHELFDHSTVRQANTTNGSIMQETCVTVTLMKFFYQLNIITGDPVYADAFEQSLYNAYLGSINTDKVIEPTIRERYPDLCLEPLPFDSYSPLTAGTRGNGVGGFKVMSDNHYYGCCACIGSAGIGLVTKMALLTTKNGFVINLFINGTMTAKTPASNNVTFGVETDYPKNGTVKFNISLDKSEKFDIMLRNPAWSKKTNLRVNGKNVAVCDGYIVLEQTWNDGDTIELELDMRTVALYPIPYGHEILMNKVIWGYNYMIPTYDEEDPIAKNHIALQRGPVILAMENRLGKSVDEPVDIKVNNDGFIATEFPESDIAPYEHILEMKVPQKDGGFVTVTDYASAGKLWTEESKMAAWLLTK